MDKITHVDKLTRVFHKTTHTKTIAHAKYILSYHVDKMAEQLKKIAYTIDIITYTVHKKGSYFNKIRRSLNIT